MPAIPAMPWQASLAKATRNIGIGRGAAIGAGLGAAKGLLSDPGVNPDGTPKSRIGAAATDAIGGGILGGGVGHLNQKYINPQLRATGLKARTGYNAKTHGVIGTNVVQTNREGRQVGNTRGALEVAQKELDDTAAAAKAKALAAKTEAPKAEEPKTPTAELKLATPSFDAVVADLNAGRAPEGAKPYIVEIIKRASAAGIEPTAELVAYNLVKVAQVKLAEYADDLHHDLPGHLDAKSAPAGKREAFGPKLKAKGCCK